VDAHLVMLPRLEAEESILATHRTAVGSGTMDSGRAHAMSNGWARTAQGKGGAGIQPKRKRSPSELSAIGIGYRGKPKR
jgi:hypothetical protein